MNDRLLNILNILIDKGSITRFAEEDNFEVFTQYSVFDMMTWLNFEITGDVMRVRFTHLMGTLELDQGANPRDLINVLVPNRYSYKRTSGLFFLSTTWTNSLGISGKHAFLPSELA